MRTDHVSHCMEGPHLPPRGRTTTPPCGQTMSPTAWTDHIFHEVDRPHLPLCGLTKFPTAWKDLVSHHVDRPHLPPCGRTRSSLSPHPPWTPGSLHPPAVVSNAALSLGGQIPAFNSFGQIPLVESLGHTPRPHFPFGELQNFFLQASPQDKYSPPGAHQPLLACLLDSSLAGMRLALPR